MEEKRSNLMTQRMLLLANKISTIVFEVFYANAEDVLIFKYFQFEPDHKHVELWILNKV